MGVWRVLVEDWQQECCGEPFAIGDRVRWRLLAVPVPDRWAGLAVDLDADAAVERTSDDDDDAATTVRQGGLTACWKGSPPRQGRLRARALLVEDHHVGVPAHLPTTSGVVRRIRVVTEQFVPGAHEREWVRAAVPPDLEDIDRVPRFFGRDSTSSATVHRSQTGALVDLEVRDPGGDHEK